MIKKLSRIYSLAFILHFVIFVQIYGQDIALFENQIPVKKYQELLEKEKDAHGLQDALERASAFAALASEATALSDSLGELLYARAMEAAEVSQSDSMVARVWMRGSIPFINTGQYITAEDRLDRAFEFWRSAGDSLDLADCFILQGYLERLKGRHYLALENLHKAKSIQSIYMEPYEMWNIANRTMLNYADLGDYQSAVDVGEEYLSQADKEKDSGGYNLVLRNTGNFLFYNKEYTKARAYIEEGLKPFMVGRYPKYLSHSYLLLYEIALEEANYDLADSYADSTIYYSNQFDSPRLESDAHLSKYNILKILGREEELSYHVEKAYSSAIVSNHKQSVLEAASARAEYESSQSNFKLGYGYLAIADSLRKEIFSEELTAELDELEKRLLLEKSQSEIDMLHEQNELKAQNLEKASRLRTVLIGLLGLALASCGLIYLLLRQRSNYNKTLEKKNTIISESLSEKELLLREIHHRVKNNLQFISSLLRLQSDHVTDPTALDALQQGHDRVRSMALIHQDLYKEDNLTGVSTKSYFTKLITGLFKSSNIHDERVKFDLAIEDLNLDVDTIVPIGLITNELITNSLKYGFPDNREGDIHVEFKERDDTIHLIVSDNGIGMSSDQQVGLGSSFGYKLVSALVGQLEGEFSIKGDIGTSVNISIMKYKKV